jgi:hypothetical protein
MLFFFFFGSFPELLPKTFVYVSLARMCLLSSLAAKKAGGYSNGPPVRMERLPELETAAWSPRLPVPPTMLSLQEAPELGEDVGFAPPSWMGKKGLGV